MIPNQWYAVLESKEIQPGKAVGVTRLAEKLVFWRDTQGKLSCFRDLCPHRGVALSRGEVLKDHTLMCPFHGFRFESSGRCTLIPANGRSTPVPQAFRAFSYPVYEAHGFVFLYWGQQANPESLPQPRFFHDLDESFRYATVQDLWEAHYSRVIENQLDVPHVPFIHKDTIGRGNRTLIDGPRVEWQDADRFLVFVNNRLDDGGKPVRPADMPRPDAPFHLDFIFPNLWQNHISANVRVLVAFVPVDEEHTILYLRFYQNFMRAPLLGQLITNLAMPYNLKIAHQDKGVVETQRPKRSGLRTGEKLIPADHPIIEYRRRREELLGEAQVEVLKAAV